MAKSLVLLFCLACAFGTADAQVDGVCADALEAYKVASAVPRGGLHMTSVGEVRALVVFVQFAEEDRAPESTVWPLTTPASAPTYFNTFVDPSSTSSLNNGNLSHFYRQMSFNQLIIYGQPYFAVTQHPESYYIGLGGLARAYSLANAEVLQALDGQVNYADYDNWTFTPYDAAGHHLGPDGNVDLIVMLYRNSSYPGGGAGFGASGIARLGIEPDLFMDGTSIRFDFPWNGSSPPCSGITNGGGWAGQSLSSVRHEIGHFLFERGIPRTGSARVPSQTITGSTE